jgi:hypothetical protein
MLDMAVPHTATCGANTQSSLDTFIVDIEQRIADIYLQNTTVNNFSWKSITVNVKDHKTKQPKALLHDVSGIVKAGTLTLLHDR